MGFLSPGHQEVEHSSKEPLGVDPTSVPHSPPAAPQHPEEEEPWKVLANPKGVWRRLWSALPHQHNSMAGRRWTASRVDIPPGVEGYATRWTSTSGWALSCWLGEQKGRVCEVRPPLPHEVPLPGSVGTTRCIPAEVDLFLFYSYFNLRV